MIWESSYYSETLVPTKYVLPLWKYFKRNKTHLHISRRAQDFKTIILLKNLLELEEFTMPVLRFGGKFLTKHRQKLFCNQVVSLFAQEWTPMWRLSHTTTCAAMYMYLASTKFTLLTQEKRNVSMIQMDRFEKLIKVRTNIRVEFCKYY